MITGNLLKLKNTYQDKIKYELPIGEQLVCLNELIGKEISLEYTGNIHCISTGKKIKKSYGQGYSFEAFMTLPECDQCIFQPELCHYHLGTCRDNKWGEDNCLKPHVVYLANSSSLKVGITKKKNVPFRWMDQGAVSAIVLCEVPDRLKSGKIEIEIKKIMNDKTNWRKMLKNDVVEVDLLAKKKEIWQEYSDLFKKYEASDPSDELYSFNYPVTEYPTKVKSFNFDKDPLVKGTLMGIKGQYLILDQGVINVRKYQGYEVNLSY